MLTNAKEKIPSLWRLCFPTNPRTPKVLPLISSFCRLSPHKKQLTTITFRRLLQSYPQPTPPFLEPSSPTKMPPYAGEESTTMVATREEMHDAFYADITSPIKAPNAMPNDDDNSTAAESQEQPESPGKLDFILDFNPCQSMSSAVFKVRTCSYCGHSCSKVRACCSSNPQSSV